MKDYKIKLFKSCRYTPYNIKISDKLLSIPMHVNGSNLIEKNHKNTKFTLITKKY